MKFIPKLHAIAARTEAKTFTAPTFSGKKSKSGKEIAMLNNTTRRALGNANTNNVSFTEIGWLFSHSEERGEKSEKIAITENIGTNRSSESFVPMTRKPKMRMEEIANRSPVQKLLLFQFSQYIQSKLVAFEPKPISDFIGLAGNS